MPDGPRNPFRREGDAFRVLMMVVAAGAIVIVVTLLTRPLVGALVGLALVAVGLWRAWGWVREWFAAQPASEEERDPGKEPRR